MINPVRRSIDLFVTLVLWIYFIFGFLFLFLPRYMLAYMPLEGRELRFQKLHYLFFSRFFALIRFLIPSLSLEIDSEVKDIKSSVVVCNHISYLDPLLMISQFEKQKTIVKSGFFRVPVFSWLIKQSGYVPAVGNGVSAWQVFERILRLGDYLTTGANIFVFPEGTRSRTGRIGKLSNGAFEIAYRSRAPIKILFIENSNRLFEPGRFLFNTAIDCKIRMRVIETLEPDYTDPEFSVERLKDDVTKIFEKENGDK